MKILVVWEDPKEREQAEHMAQVLDAMTPMLSEAKVDRDGQVTIHHNANLPMTKVPVACGNWDAHMDAFTRAMLRV